MLDDSVYAPFSIARSADGTRVELGRGAMGITYRATDTQLGRTVALKVINATYLGDPIARQRFLTEARAAAQLHHSNVAGVYQLRADGEDIFYAMEFVEGETVDAHVRRRGPLPSRLALRIILQAAQGLAAADARGLIHRDIKPANLMLAQAPAPVGEGIEHEEEDGLLVKVIDFGLARSVGGNETGGGLTGGNVVGTPYYMSPEQISPEMGSTLDCRSDIYSLGVTLWYLLAGRAPFEGSQFQILSQHLQKRPPLEQLTDVGVPAEVVTLIGSMLAKDRDERPANYAALIAALKKILRGGGSTTFAAVPRREGGDATMVMPSSVRPSSSQIEPRQIPEKVGGSGRPTWLIPAALGAAALVTMAIWQPWRRAVPTGGDRPAESAVLNPQVSEARRLSDQARALLIKPGGGATKYDTAALLCDRALALDPTDADAWAIASQVDTKMAYHSFDRSEKRLESARSKAARALNLAPNSFEVRLSQAAYLSYLTEPPISNQAEPVLRALRDENPRDFRVHDALGVLLRTQGRLVEAVASFDDAAQLPGGAAGGLIQKAWALYRLRRYAECEVALDQSIAIEPLAGSISLKIFLELSWYGDPDRALSTLRKLPASESMEDVGVAAAIRLYTWRREPAELLKLMATVPREWITWSVWGPKAALTGDANAELKRPAAAQADWQSALALIDQRLVATPNDRNLLEWKAYVLASLGETGKAAEMWERARQIPKANIAVFAIERIQRLASPDAVIDELERRAKVASESLDRGEPVIDGIISAADLRLNPAWDQARGLQRFQALQARLEADPRFSPKSKAPDARNASAVDPKSVAVMAFENLSDDKSNEYFSDGISEELLTVLQKIPGLRVAARTSAFSFKGKNATAREIGQQLGVAQLVEGSVRKSGSSVRIAARLSRADTGEQIWSENYTRDLKDVFAVQTEIAQTILEQLRGRFDGAPGGAAVKAQIQSQVKAAEKGGTKSVEAYQHYLRGRFQENQFSSEGLANALVSYRKAVELDPGFALGWAALSETYSLQTGWDSGDQPLEEGFKRAREAVDRAVALEPNLAEALLALGRLQIWHDFDWRGGKASARRALELAPSSAQGLGFLAECEAAVGNVERALELGRQAITLDPLNPEIRLNHGIYLSQRGPYAEAADEFRRTLEITPNAIGARANWSTAALLDGQVDEAVAIAEKDTPGWGRAYALSLAYWQQGRRAEADAQLRALEDSFAQAAAYQVGEVYAYRGESDKAFAWLDRAYQQRDPGIVYLKLDRLLLSLHADPRWAALMHRAGLADDRSK